MTPPSPETHPTPWRQALSAPELIIAADNVPAGQMDSPDLAARVVEAVNEKALSHPTPSNNPEHPRHWSAPNCERCNGSGVLITRGDRSDIYAGWKWCECAIKNRGAAQPPPPTPEPESPEAIAAWAKSLAGDLVAAGEAERDALAQPPPPETEGPGDEELDRVYTAGAVGAGNLGAAAIRAVFNHGRAFDRERHEARIDDYQRALKREKEHSSYLDGELAAARGRVEELERLAQQPSDALPAKPSQSGQDER